MLTAKKMTPKSKPQATRSQIISLAKKSWPKSNGPFPDVLVIGIRGYYLNTMGKPGVNDRGIYDDAVFVVGPETFASFNANVDPSAFRKGIATLIPGWYPYRPGNHGISRPGGGYPAFRPATKGEALSVYRDGENGPSKRAGIAINIHRGGYRTTSSLGCQTIHPAQWQAFYSLTRSEMKKANLTRFWYGLLDGMK